ncbi:Hypothetical predicted protein [Paramuricea clavata]|uniref:Uncharacterized protein n=1 Tax=Paramuricea clavata TaxID=317549 RepID=A0A7D9EC54_PARCT|nr:Hypothetical predicted protein [Paramuricea clavata]
MVKYVVLRAEDVLYGKIYPKLGWEPVGCEYYREWLVRKCKERNELNKLNLDEKIADARIKVDHSGGVSDKVREEYGYIYGSSCRNCGNRFISGSNEIRDRCKRRICGGCSKVTTPKLGCVRSHSRGQACDFRVFTHKLSLDVSTVILTMKVVTQMEFLSGNKSSLCESNWELLTVIETGEVVVTLEDAEDSTKKGKCIIPKCKEEIKYSSFFILGFR